MSCLLGIDIGTSGTKVVLLDLKGKIIASSTQQYPLSQPFIGWAEQEPEDWWEAAVNGIRSVILHSNVDPLEIKGIGLTGQMHGMVLLDSSHNILRPAIIWCDQRTGNECLEITEAVGKDKLLSITGNLALTGFTASKIIWVKNHQPEIFEKIRKILLPKDYIRFKLSGELATDVSDASATNLMDIRKCCWSDEILGRLGIPAECMPTIFGSYEISGYVSKEAANITGLKAGTPIVGGAGDQIAGAVGNGIVKPGIISSVIGTSGVVIAQTDELVIDNECRVHTFCHAIPNTWCLLGVTQGAGLSLKWFLDNFGGMEEYLSKFANESPYFFINKEASSSPVGSQGLIYLPYLMGERTPHLDPNAKGVFFGLTAKHNRSDFIRSIMEGVTYSLKDCLELIKRLGIRIDEVRVSGGGGKSSLWRQIQADIYDCDVTTLKSDEGPSSGSAILASVGVGIYGNIIEACDDLIKKDTLQKPVKDNIDIYSRYYSIYKELYGALKDQFKNISKI